ncbi:hypothetical protein V2P24_02870 [Mycoplasma putrefaciens]|uniref:hypothetical protein n=1 Tax=Mycoplasma putrefaciens TaxID=2123 RepID=UPI003DA3FFEB
MLKDLNDVVRLEHLLSCQIVLFFVSEPDNNFANKELARINPKLILDGKYPRLIKFEMQLDEKLTEKIKMDYLF